MDGQLLKPNTTMEGPLLYFFTFALNGPLIYIRNNIRWSVAIEILQWRAIFGPFPLQLWPKMTYTLTQPMYKRRLIHSSAAGIHNPSPPPPSPASISPIPAGLHTPNLASADARIDSCPRGWQVLDAGHSKPLEPSRTRPSSERRHGCQPPASRASWASRARPCRLVGRGHHRAPQERATSALCPLRRCRRPPSALIVSNYI